MGKLPIALTNLIEAFERLPGIGPKTAQRLGFYLIHVPEYEIQKFADALIGLKRGTVKCSICFNIAESDPCRICEDSQRDKSKILVVEQPIDVLHFERTGKFNGLYHVLHGRIDPLNNIGPDDIYIPQLIVRIKGSSFYKHYEVILAMNPDMEGEATAMYLQKKLKVKSQKSNIDLKITRLAYGLPVGASVEFTDGITLSRALEGRREFS
jgi:recombination protein RecR